MLSFSINQFFLLFFSLKLCKKKVMKFHTIYFWFHISFDIIYFYLHCNCLSNEFMIFIKVHLNQKIILSISVKVFIKHLLSNDEKINERVFFLLKISISFHLNSGQFDNQLIINLSV